MWATDVDPATLDLDYYGLHSGEKLVSPLVLRLVDETTGELDAAARLALAKVALTRYGSKWSHIWAALNLSYNPLENYAMEEIEAEAGGSTREASNGRTTNTERTGENSNTTETKYNNEQRAAQSARYGFNSVEAVPTDTGTETQSGGNTVGTEGTTGETIEGSESSTEKAEETRLNNRNLTRRGNIGVTTSQQMLENEINVRRNVFFKMVYVDIDEVLTLPIY